MINLLKSEILHLSCDSLRSSGVETLRNIPDLLLPNQEMSILNRYNGLCNLLKHSVFEDYLLRRPEQEEAAAIAKEALFSGRPMPENILRILVEVVRLSEWYQQREEGIARDQEKEELKSLFRMLKGHSSMMNVVKDGQLKISEELLTKIFEGKIQEITVVTDPVDYNASNRDYLNYRGIFLQLIEPVSISGSLKLVSDHFENSGDDSLIFLLYELIHWKNRNSLQLAKKMRKIDMLRFESLLEKAYLKRLPLWKRILKLLFSQHVSTKEIEYIDREISRKRLKELKHIKMAGRSLNSEKCIKQVATDSYDRSIKKRLNKEEAALFRRIVEYIHEREQKGMKVTGSDILSVNIGDRLTVARVLGLIDSGNAAVSEVMRVSDEAGSYYSLADALKKNSVKNS